MNHFLRCLTFLAMSGAAANAVAQSAPPTTTDVSYAVNSAGEINKRDRLPANAIRLVVEGTETVDGRVLTWWSLTAQRYDGLRFGVRLLSEGVPMRRGERLGEVARYIYSGTDGRAIEYVDESTGRALLPALRFEDGFLPTPADDAAYPDGFATSGMYLGHSLVRTATLAWITPLEFAKPKTLVLRSDLMMGAQAWPCSDCSKVEGTDGSCESRPCTEPETRELIADGFNLFSYFGEQDRLLLEEPVFFRGMAELHFPDWFYRSNHFPGSMYIDEPSIRFGFNPHVPRWDLQGPEQLAEGLRMRVAEQFKAEDRRVPLGDQDGALDLHYNNAPSWETHYWSAWQQLKAGAAALVYEGRYVDNTYGWHPDMHFGGEGLEGITLLDQLDFTHGFMRGAARAFDGDWGTSMYSEGNREYFDDAFIHAYNNGAKYLWFWAYQLGNGNGITNEQVRRLCKTMKDYAKAHPRASKQAAIEAGTLGIVLPPGYVYSPGTIMGMDANQISPGGATYGDISTAAFFEGILAPHRGISYDVINDEPRIHGMGYERLVYVRPDGSLDPVPPWTEERPARGLSMSCEVTSATPLAARQSRPAEYNIPRMAAIAIDGKLDDWKDIPWIDMGTDVQTSLEETVLYVDNSSAPTAFAKDGREYLGFKYAQLTTEHQVKYHLKDYYILGDRWIQAGPGLNVEKQGVVITDVTPGSPADLAGLRPGDVIDYLHEKRTKYEFMVHQCLGWYTKIPTLDFHITRSTHEKFGGASDLSGAIALALDETHLYFAARVADDVHAQAGYGNAFWEGDAVIIGLDPVLNRSENGYRDEDHEIAFALHEGKAIAWRNHGRPGQGVGVVKNINLRITRLEGQTLYEAAIPINELQPFAPGMWPKVGFNAVFTDNDGANLASRESRLELRDGAQARAKNPYLYPVFECAAADAAEKVSAGLFWKRRITPEVKTVKGLAHPVDGPSFEIEAFDEATGFFRLTTETYAPVETTARATAVLQSLDSPQTPAVRAQLDIPAGPAAKEYTIRVSTQSPPGRYALQLWVDDGIGGVAATDRRAVYIYPHAIERN